jgi:hypothetical protein
MDIDDRLRDLVRSVDRTDIASVDHLKPERRDLLVVCASGRAHLLRLEAHAVSLLRQKWGYERLREGGVPCPEIEAFLEPDAGDDASGCLVLSWVDAIPAAHIIEREGPGERTYALCRKLGRALRELHSYRLALLIRLARPFTFVGSTREQIVHVVEAQDLAQLDLDVLYQ